MAVDSLDEISTNTLPGRLTLGAEQRSGLCLGIMHCCVLQQLCIHGLPGKAVVRSLLARAWWIALETLGSRPLWLLAPVGRKGSGGLPVKGW